MGDFGPAYFIVGGFDGPVETDGEFLGYRVLGSGSGGYQIMNLANALAPTPVGVTGIGGRALISGGRIYSASGILDARNGLNLLGTLPNSANLEGVYARSNNLIAAVGGNDLVLYDIGDAANAREVGRHPLARTTLDMFWEGDTLVEIGATHVILFDTSNPGQPRVKRHFTHETLEQVVRLGPLDYIGSCRWGQAVGRIDRIRPDRQPPVETIYYPPGNINALAFMEPNLLAVSIGNEVQVLEVQNDPNYPVVLRGSIIIGSTSELAVVGNLIYAFVDRTGPVILSYTGPPYQQGADAAFVVSDGLPNQLAPQQHVQAQIRVQNSGQTTWSSPDYALAIVDDAGNLTPESRIYLPQGTSIAPGSSADFTVGLTAPANFSGGLLRLQMVHELVTFFGPIIERNVQVGAPGGSAAAVWQIYD